MMKSFFKKLSFVMALAMVLTSAAPAGAVFAAEAGVSLQGTKDIVTEGNVEVGATVDYSFQGAPADWKTTFDWTSSNPAVATVNKAGVVTGIADGVATITITAGADKSYEHSVVVTVGLGEIVKVDYSFVANQINTTDVVLTFGDDVDLTGVTAENFEVTAIDDMFEYTLFANTATVDENTVKLTFVEGVLTDGAVIKIAYQGEEDTVVASAGEVARVEVTYGMDKNYKGDAYVYTDLDPDYVLLSYKLYDAKNIDVTALYEENVDYTIEWTLTAGGDYASEPEEDSDNGWQMSFDAKGAATVRATVTFADEDGEETPINSAPATILAKDRPTIAFTYEEAGVSSFVAGVDNTLNAITSFNTPDGTFWKDNMYKDSIKKGTTAWYAARLTDNRGKGLVTTQLEYNSKSDLLTDGETEYKDYGYFVYESSNEDVLYIDDDGCVTGVNVGSATILVSFVKINDDGEEMDPVKVCSTRIKVTTDYPEPYAKTFEILYDSLSVTSTAGSVNATTYIQFYDQYGNVYTFGSTKTEEDCEESGATVNNAAVVTVPSTYDDAINLFTIGAPVKNDYTGKKYAYPVNFHGADFMDLENTDIKDNGYGTFKFTVSFDKDIDEFSKIVTKSDKVGVKVYNVDEYYTELMKFYSKETPAAYLDGTGTVVDADFVKWNWGTYCTWGNYVDTYTDKRSEFGSCDWAGTQTGKTVGVGLYSPAGLYLDDLPGTHFIDITGQKVDKINKLDEEKRGLIEGAIYYQINVPSKAENYAVATDDTVTFTFNKIDEDDDSLILPATAGTYSVTMYYVNNKNKLVKLPGGSQNITVVNSTPAVKAEGFKETNVYDGSIKTYAEVEKALTEMYNFSWNGELLYDEDREQWNELKKKFEAYKASDNFRIYDIEYDPIDKDDTKVVITKVIFEIGYFEDCIVDGKGGVTDNENGNYQLYELKKRITIKMDK